MRCAALTTLFFALFALFSTMTYAAPVVGRQMCGQYGCRVAAPATTPPSGSTTSSESALLSAISALLAMMANNNNSNNTPTTTVVTAASSSAPPASDPTGTSQSMPTMRWFTDLLPLL
ncbi:hypothetical protein BGY98DRAFT_62414 [Russula aff. rugulosa BPL654]|nr:hypothetical protein BGY98DRAFT_396463 [Russula aff. rugulosa BPL654]KAI0282826.1 hypothetical protein BGY98DRAFT_62414 [Russula aff. rugulosa BPL654]